MRSGGIFFLLGACLILVFIADISFGSVKIPISEVFHILCGKPAKDSWVLIILDFRIPKAITAMLSGAGLSVCGLLMQTLFRNPLAGPYVLGINSGASLGVAIVMLSAGTYSVLLTSLFKMGIIASAALGAMLVMFLILAVSRNIRDNATILILGIMFGQIAGAAEGVLQYFSRAESLQGFVIWGMGNFTGVVWKEMLLFAPVVLLGLACSFFLSKPLNALLLGDKYASSLGVKVRRTRTLIIASTGILAGCITAFCGPVAFIGVAVPHLTRALLNTADHKHLVPGVCLFGALLTLLCDLLTQMPGSDQVLPVNVVTSLIGAPVVIWVILRQKQLRSFSS
jgi:iron complex transport system permease protein